MGDIRKPLSSILDSVQDMDYYYEYFEHINNRVEELHVIRDADGKPVSLRVVMLYDRGH